MSAHRAGLRTIIFPARNKGDLDDILKASRPTVFEHVAAVGGSVPELDRDRLPVAANA
jgi:ATP-dependent Lon protease